MKNFLILRKQFFTVFLLLAIFFVACTKKKEAEVWYCPMHTHYQSDHAGKCPICGMNLVKKENTDITGNKEEQKDEHKSHAEQATPTENSITVSADAQQRAGIVTTRPSKRQLSMTLTLAGEVAYEPDIYAATIEYRQLVAAGQTLDASMGGFNLTQSALLRLRQMGLSKDEIHQYAHSNTAASRLITGTGAGYAL
ncbi:MAG TPA: heavy metal-binding domain-containing protein, partial [Turneriella sp.]|nr:heavy metal-binding domain-containing protein [Turneriella sp.]